MYTEVHPHAIINHDPCPSTQTPVQSRQEDGSAVSLMCALMPASQQKKIEEMKMGPEIRRGNLTFVFLRRQLKRQHKTILLLPSIFQMLRLHKSGNATYFLLNSLLKDVIWQGFPSLEGIMLPVMFENKLLNLLCIFERRKKGGRERQRERERKVKQEQQL